MRPLWYLLNIQSSHSPDNSEVEVYAPGLKAVTWHSHSTRTVLVRRCRNMPWLPQTLHSCSPACGLCHSSAPVTGWKTSFLLKFLPASIFFISPYWRLCPDERVIISAFFFCPVEPLGSLRAGQTCSLSLVSGSFGNRYLLKCPSY